MPDYLLCIGCGHNSFKIISEKEIVCTNCNWKNTIKDMKETKEKNQAEMAMEENNMKSENDKCPWVLNQRFG